LQIKARKQHVRYTYLSLLHYPYRCKLNRTTRASHLRAFRLHSSTLPAAPYYSLLLDSLLVDSLDSLSDSLLLEAVSPEGFPSPLLNASSCSLALSGPLLEMPSTCMPAAMAACSCVCECVC